LKSENKLRTLNNAIKSEKDQKTSKGKEKKIQKVLLTIHLKTFPQLSKNQIQSIDLNLNESLVLVA